MRRILIVVSTDLSEAFRPGHHAREAERRVYTISENENRGDRLGYC
jgi:hypothetical protein